MKRLKNDQVMELVKSLKTLSIEKKVPLWKRVASELEKPTRARREVNIYKIDACARDGEIVIVPGKVLGTGSLSKKVSVAALNFSDSAKAKIESNNGEVLSIKDLMDKNPSASKVRIMG